MDFLKKPLFLIGVSFISTVLVFWLVVSLVSEPCPQDFNAMDEFDMERYKGTWHEFARLSVNNRRGYQDCN